MLEWGLLDKRTSLVYFGLLTDLGKTKKTRKKKAFLFPEESYELNKLVTFNM